jgi:hypothetical protein
MASGSLLCGGRVNAAQLINTTLAPSWFTLAAATPRLCVRFPTGLDRDICYDVIVSEDYTAAAAATMTLWISSPSTNSGQSSRWAVQFERLIAGTTDMGADSFSAGDAVVLANDATADDLQAATIALTSAEMDAVAAGEPMRVKIFRTGTTTDDLGDNADFHGWKIVED